MKPIFNIKGITLMNENESKVFEKYINLGEKFIDGEVEITKMKQAIGFIGNLTRVVQSRSATAALTFMISKSDPTILTRITKKEVIEKPKKIKGKK